MGAGLLACCLVAQLPHDRVELDSSLVFSHRFDLAPRRVFVEGVVDRGRHMASE